MLSTKEILDRIDMPALLEQIGFDDVNPLKLTYLGFCIFHDDSATKSFYVNYDSKTFKCFGACNKRGNAIQLYAWWKNISVEAAKVELSNLEESRSLLTLDRQLTVKEIVPLWRKFELLTSYVDKMPLITATPYKEYMNKRGISDATLNAFGIRGWKEIEVDEHEVASYVELGILKRRDNGIYDRFSEYQAMFSNMNDGTVTFLQGRAVVQREDRSKYLNVRGACVNPYNVQALYHETNEVFICEGVPDVLSMVELGFQNTVGILGVSSFRPEWLDLFHLRRVIVALDNDDAGNKGFDNLREIFQAKGIEAVRFKAHEGFKDINQWLMSKKSLTSSV